ncbi:hypothetical protein GEV33_001543 [Tenebrio molitor]|uniref:Tc1-like transposase DDE domain-containing protein n=1 Tax=Tenebrio molitor TaxID=7067 RepID=A0A8J6HW52_TENMO|nr:hypothetical protein GEV33_001543 [Tenebrio molitor]
MKFAFLYEILRDQSWPTLVPVLLLTRGLPPPRPATPTRQYSVDGFGDRWIFSGTQTAATKSEYSEIRKLDSKASGSTPGGQGRPDPLVMDCLILAISAECDLSSCAEYSSDHIIRMMRFSHCHLTNFGSVRGTGRRRDCPGRSTFFTRRCSTGVMVWGAICYGSRSPLIFIQGSMNARRYVQEVLQPVLVPYVQDIPNGLYQQDNARPHIARVSLEYLEHANVNLLPWPPRSPDLSPIEHVWDMIGQRLKNLARRPQTIQQLRHEIQVIWDALPQEEIDNLIRSMPRHVAECVNLQGGPTHY